MRPVECMHGELERVSVGDDTALGGVRKQSIDDYS